MKKNKIEKRTRILLAVCALCMIVVLFVPLWKIDLIAPQYPEGLALLIYPNRLSGNVDIINGLNHYIGMKTLHTTDFTEFLLLPYIIGFFALLFIIVGIFGNRKLLYAASLLFICFGILAMYDFWKWEYNYGHNLNPDAAIIVPGMAYQPPLIGYKQLLNFSAYSFPASGGWLFAGSGLLLLFSAVSEWSLARKQKRNLNFAVICLIVPILFFSSCNTKPEPIIAGKDQCDYCKMTVSDNRFGAEAVTKKGKIYKFDDTKCLLAFTGESSFDRNQIDAIYFVNFSNDHALIASGKVVLLNSDQLHSPMGGNIAAFENTDSLNKVLNTFGGKIVYWDKLYTHE